MDNWRDVEGRKKVRALEELGRTRLSEHFFLRDFLYSEIAQVFGIFNVPHNPDLAIEAGSQLCRNLLEPLKATFGDVRIRSGYRSPQLNTLGHRLRLGCASNERNFAAHIWDRRDSAGRMGAMATIVIPWFTDRYEHGADWRAMAWWIHDHLPYSYMSFHPKLAAFNIQWREEPEKKIVSWISPTGILTRSGMNNQAEDHSSFYADFPDMFENEPTCVGSHT
jgi:hypothetical protein